MSPAQIDIGVASKIGQAGRAMGNAIEALGGAFGELAGRVGQAQGDQAYADAKLETLKGQDAIAEDVYGRVTDEDTSPYYEVPDQLGELNTSIEKKYLGSMTPKQQREFRQWRETQTFRVGKSFREQAQGAEVKRFDMGFERDSAGLIERIGTSDDPMTAWTQAREIVNDKLASAGSRLTAQERLERGRKINSTLGIAAITRLESLEDQGKVPFGTVQSLREQIEAAEKEYDAPQTTSSAGPSDAASRVLAADRKRFFDELDNDPQLAAVVRGLIRKENYENPDVILEAMMNRASMRNSTIRKEVFGGFYGPINRKEVQPRGWDDVTKRAFDRVRAGSNDIKLYTDQGYVGYYQGKYRNEHQPALKVGIQPEKIKGEHFSPMGREGVAWKKKMERLIAEGAAGGNGAATGGPLSEVVSGGDGTDNLDGGAGVGRAGEMLVATPEEREVMEAWGPPAENPNGTMRVLPGSGRDDGIIRNEMRDKMIEEGAGFPRQELMQRISALTENVDPDTKLAEAIPPEELDKLPDEVKVAAADMTVGEARQMLANEDVEQGEPYAPGIGMSEDPTGPAQNQPAYGAGRSEDPATAKAKSAEGFTKFLAGQGRLKAGQVFTVDMGMGKKFSITSDDINGMDRKVLQQLWKRGYEQQKMRTARMVNDAELAMRSQENNITNNKGDYPGYDGEAIRGLLEKTPGGAKKWNDHVRKMNAARRFGSLTAEKETLTDEVLMDRLRESEPDETADVDEYKAYRAAERQIKKFIADRQKDPAKAVEAHPEMRLAREEAKQFTGARANLVILEKRLELQERLFANYGREYIDKEAQVLTAEEAKHQRKFLGDMSRDSVAKYLNDTSEAYGKDMAYRMFRSIIKHTTKAGSEQAEDLTNLITKAVREPNYMTRDDMIRMRSITSSARSAQEVGGDVQLPESVGRREKNIETFIRMAEYNRAAEEGRSPGQGQPLNRTIINHLLTRSDDPRTIATFNKLYNNGKPGFAERIIATLGRK